MSPQILQNLIRERNQISRNHILKVSSLMHVQLLAVLDDIPDHLEVEQRFAALELDLQSLSRGVEHQLDGSLGRLSRHIVLGPVGADARYLTVVAGVVAAKGHDEEVDLGKHCEEALLGAV